MWSNVCRKQGEKQIYLCYNWWFLEIYMDYLSIHKEDTFDEFVVFARKIQKQIGRQIQHIRSDHGTEFENANFSDYCDEQGISHNFSAPRTPQQNGVVERKNRTLEEMARTMLISSGLPKNFWAEAVSTACYILNRALIRPLLNKTPYELFKGRKPNIMYFKVFGSKCYVIIMGNKI